MIDPKSFTVISKGSVLPDDFVIDDDLNHEKYVIEVGIESENYWRSEYESDLATAEMIGAVVIGSDAYKDFRYRLRIEEDGIYNPSNSVIGTLVRNALIQKYE